MSFYSELSRYYDEIFAVEPGDMDYLKGRLSGLKNLLDLGCGTGNKTELLAETGREIVGLDLDADMIALAAARHAAPGVTYQVGDMSGIGLKFPAGRFDGIICLGNTLVHLTEPLALESFMVGVERVLAPGGLLAIQILNYDFILETRLAELPVIETGHVVFRRYYDWLNDGKLSFRTSLEIKGGEFYENAVVLLPLTKGDLTSLLAGGFTGIEFLGGIDGRNFVPNGLATMVMARRR